MAQRDQACLSSWKEIAAYLGKGVRTVQRWEDRLGLPVRRPDGSKSGIVQSTPAELDEWLKTTWSPKSNQATATASSQIHAKVEASIEEGARLRRINRQLVSELESSVRRLRYSLEALGMRATQDQHDGLIQSDSLPTIALPNPDLQSAAAASSGSGVDDPVI